MKSSTNYCEKVRPTFAQINNCVAFCTQCKRNALKRGKDFRAFWKNIYPLLDGCHLDNHGEWSTW